MGEKILIGGISYEVKGDSFLVNIHNDDLYEQVHITPLYDKFKLEWFQIIFSNGDKRFIQSALWGWKFFDQVPEPENEISPEAEVDLELAINVGEAIEAHYHIE